MAKTTNTSKKTKETEQTVEPWISMHAGVKIVIICSILMAALTAWQVIPYRGWLEGIAWGLLFGVLIWIIFFGNIYVNRLLRRKH